MTPRPVLIPRPAHETEECATLLGLTAAGDALAYAELVRRYQPAVLRTSRRMLRHREDALDATQETFLKVLVKASAYRGEAAVAAWIHRIAVNTCLDAMRRKRRRQTTDLDETADAADPRSEDGYHAVESENEIEAALTALPPWLRTAVALSVDGLRLDDIAAVLGVPVGTVKSGMHRARRQAQRRGGWPAVSPHAG